MSDKDETDIGHVLECFYDPGYTRMRELVKALFNERDQTRKDETELKALNVKIAKECVAADETIASLRAERDRLREVNLRFKKAAILLIRWAERSLRGDTDVVPYEPVKEAREAIAFAEKAVQQ